MKKIKVSVGIPAYNEEANIGELLRRMLAQKQGSWQLLEILVYSDGSTDATASIARSLKSRKIHVYDYSSSLGQQARQNEMIKRYRGDLLLIAEADTLPADRNTIENLVAPYVRKSKDKLGMTVGVDIASVPANFFEKIVYCWNSIKQSTFAEFRGGENLYTTGGHTMRVLSRGFADKITFALDAPEDSFCYLKLKELGFNMQRVGGAKILTTTIATKKDRLDHGKRFYQGKIKLQKYFDKNTIDSEYFVPKRLFLKHFLIALLRSPLITLIALFEFLATAFRFKYFESKSKFREDLAWEGI